MIIKTVLSRIRQVGERLCPCQCILPYLRCIIRQQEEYFQYNLRILQEIKRRQGVILVKVSELLGEFTTMSTQLDKVRAEVLAKIAELEALLADANVPQEATDALNEIKAKIQGMDDIVPDVP